MIHPGWDGGTFKLTLQFSDDYPNKPPTVQFISRMFHHPNIYADGSICLDILQNQWSHIYNVAAILQSRQQLGYLINDQIGILLPFNLVVWSQIFLFIQRFIILFWLVAPH